MRIVQTIDIKNVVLYVTFKVRHLSGYANIESENRNAEKQCSLFNNLLDKKSSNINTTRNYCFPEIN